LFIELHKFTNITTLSSCIKWFSRTTTTKGVKTTTTNKGVYHVTKDEAKNVFSSRGIEWWMVGYYELGKNQYYELE
jgi:hypothetical protein